MNENQGPMTPVEPAGLPDGCPDTVGYSKDGLFCSYSIHAQNGPLNAHHPGCQPEHCHVLEVCPVGTRALLLAAKNYEEQHAKDLGQIAATALSELERLKGTTP